MKKIYYYIIAFTMFVFSACDPTDFDDMNVDPTAVAEVPTRALLTNAFNSRANSVNSTNVGVISTLWGVNSPVFYVQHLSEGPYPGASLYNIRNFDWSGYYTGPLYNLKAIIDLNEANSPLADPGANGSKNNQIAVARILKAYTFWFLTDKYGDIPYSQALKGDANFSPKYDPQKDIYYDLFKEMKEAYAQINTAEKGVVGDILFNGDMAKWKKFSATARMYMAMRLIKNDNAKAKSEFASAVADGVLASNADNVLFMYSSSDPNNYNPWYFNYSVSNRNDYAISTTLTGYMSPKSDPRLPIYGENLPSGVVGLSYGSSAARNIPGVYSRVGDAFRQPGSPAYFFTYAQVLFTYAEAAKVGVIAGGDALAQTYYQDAIKASFQMYGVSGTADANYAAYMTKPGVAYTPANGLQQIMTEKWVHTYLNGFEPWTDWRRTGFPTLTPAVNGVISSIPRRQGYPSNENAINGESYREAVARQGADALTTRIWWDK